MWLDRAIAVAAAALPILASGGLALACATKLSSPDAASSEVIPCVNAFDCPRAPNTCVISTCAERYCAMVNAAEKTPMAEQKAGDCAMLVCDGRGGTMPLEDPQDWPTDDGNACTDEACEEGAPTHSPLDIGTKCGEQGVCNGKGTCGDCLPGKARCKGNTPEACSEEGQWASNGACPEGSPICMEADASCLKIAGMSAGYHDTCARFQDGSLRCWGDRSGGVSGGGPVSIVAGLFGAVAIMAGKEHTCALLGDSTAACWGNNVDGELGDKTTTPRGAPGPVADLKDVAQIAVGAGFTCARFASGEVKCWGRNDKGQLGDGAAKKAPPSAVSARTMATEETPTPSPQALKRNVARVSSLSIGEGHACALITGGSAVCWGNDVFGQLGRGATPTAPAPAGGKGRPAPAPKPPSLVKGLKGAVDLALGEAHACARLGDGTAECWGDNTSGQLGDGSTTGKPSPTKVSGLADVVTLALGRRHSCALLSSGAVRCWGDNTAGQLGDGTTESRTGPVEVAELREVRAISARGDHTCASVRGGAIRCWGANNAGQLGDGTAENRPKPVPVVW